MAAKSAACGFFSHNSSTVPVLTEEEQILDASMHAVLDPTISATEINLEALYEATLAAPAPTTNIDEVHRRARWLRIGRGGKREEE